MKKVLLIEDSQPFINLLMKVIIREDIDCEFILQTGDLTREFIVEEIIEKKPDLILLDLNMPGAGGISILEELKHKESSGKKSNIPILILTALKASEKEIEFLKTNAEVVDFINKPIDDLTLFIKIVKKHLEISN